MPDKDFTTDYIKANEFTAEKCGVEFKIYGGSTYWKMPSTESWHDAIPDWTIADPRCREIIRERYKINTSYVDRDKWRATEMKWRKKYKDSNTSVCLFASGKTIAEAEIACILAIVEAHDNG